MNRLYGRTPRLRRLLAEATFFHWHTTTFVTAWRSDGIGAPMVLDGSSDPARHYSPTSKGVLTSRSSPTTFIALNNLTAHKTADVPDAPAAHFFLLSPIRVA